MMVVDKQQAIQRVAVIEGMWREARANTPGPSPLLDDIRFLLDMTKVHLGLRAAELAED